MEPTSERGARAPVGPALRDAKRAMRQALLATRNRLPAASHAEASAEIARRVAALESFATARSLLLTLPFRREWDTLALVRTALSLGKAVVLPRVDVATRMLELRAIGDPSADVVRGYQGIPEPRDTCPRVAAAAIDWVLVPGVGFDASGRRLGYGGGFYDRLLPLLTAATPRIAGAFECQIVDLVPAAPHDLKVDAIVTEARVIVASRA
jgi:5-formyltetrahydrofolate cyclo-ligase